MENSMKALDKTKNRATIWSSNFTAVYTVPLPNKNKDLKRYMHSNVHCSVIYDCQVWKQLKRPSSDMEKDDAIYTHTHTITQPQKKNEILPFATVWMDLEHIKFTEISHTKILVLFISRI